MARKVLSLSSLVGMVIVAFILIGYPYFFRDSLADPKFDIDPAEGKVWLDSKIILEFRGNISKEEIERDLKISPTLSLDKGNLKVEHIAKFPWHKRFPWSKTKITINHQKREIFEPEREYEIKFAGKEIAFQTITLPRVILTIPENGKKNVKPYLPIKIIFNEEIESDSKFFSIDPEVEVSTVFVQDTLFIQPESRFENSTTYKLTIKKDLADKFGHQMRKDFVLIFTTEPPIKVIEALPIGESQPLDTIVKIIFDRPPLKKAAEDSFQVKPEVKGILSWEEDDILIWTPSQLTYSTIYEISIGGDLSREDPIIAKSWQFKTADPPVFVEIQGVNQSPTTLKALATGGLGEYSFEWSNGEKREQIFVEVPAGQVWTISIKVISGDQVAYDEILVYGPPLPQPAPILSLPSVTLSDGNKIILSFDDSGRMKEILDILANYGAKAIFFPYGKWANTVPDLIQRAINEGHLVCNHTYSHANLTKLSAEAIANEILAGAIGNCDLLRPPYGAHNSFVDSIAAELGFSIYLWNIDTRDWKVHDSEKILNTVLSQAFPGAVVLMHMHVVETVNILPKMIEKLQAKGYIISW